MNVIIPGMNKDAQRLQVRPTMVTGSLFSTSVAFLNWLLILQEPETLLERYKNNEMTHLLKLHNKQPVWSEGTYT